MDDPREVLRLLILRLPEARVADLVALAQAILRPAPPTPAVITPATRAAPPGAATR